jgi:hypothetical protein
MVSWLTEKQTGLLEDFSRQLAVIRLSIFAAILILPQLFRTKTLRRQKHAASRQS